MNIQLVRTKYAPSSTIGNMIINEKVFCHTLEDTVRHQGAAKIPGKTAIPAGRYQIILSMSTRFKRIMPELLGVPGFVGIRCHGGNTAKDTEGCLLVAYNIIDANTIQGSAEADLTKILQSAPGEHYIEIFNAFPYTGI